jgi:microcystin-dependent protein
MKFQRDILEKVYPVGSYYWSQNNTNPQQLFGGKWESIQGRFLFAADANHTVGSIGGEERHKLTIDEMPRHSHGTEEYAKTNHGSWSHESRGDKKTLDFRDDSRGSGTYETGGSSSHNNMPPYLCAFCWRRIS